MKRMRWLVVSVCAALSLLAATDPALAYDGKITFIGKLLPPEVEAVSMNFRGITDVWGHKDPVTGRYYALVGDNRLGKMFVIDVTCPSSPALVGEIGGFSGGFVYDVKSWGTYAFVDDGGALRDPNTNEKLYSSRIIDISDPTSPFLLPDPFRRCHNVGVTSQGYLFATGHGGLVGYDLNAGLPSDTLNEVPFQDDNSFDGHDVTVHGNTLYDFSGSQGVDIWDLSTFPTPTLVNTVPHGNTWPALPGTYAHSGDVTDDGQYLYVCDEIIGDVFVYDLQTLTLVYTLETGSVNIHNLYIEDNLAFAAYYTAGFRVLDVNPPTAPALVDEYDTTPPGATIPRGAWGVYPWDDRGYVYISDIQNGLYVFAVEGYTPPENFPDFANGTPPEFNGSVESSAVSWVDYDDDGDLDVLFLRSPTPSELWTKNADGTYSSADFFPSALGAGWADYDNDGDLDLYIGGFGPNHLYKQGPSGTFTEVTGTPVSGNENSICVSWIDYDEDGLVDLYVANLGENKLYRNLGGDQFADATSSSGLGDTGNALAFDWADYNGDGRSDVFVANATEGVLYRNQGNGTFTPVAGTGIDYPQQPAVSTRWADYDADGDFDLIVSFAAPGAPNSVYRNDGGGTFTRFDQAVPAGYSSAAAGWFDSDNDGDIDYLVTKTQSPGGSDANRLMENVGGTFNLDPFSGLELCGQNSKGFALGDDDGDGDLDVLMVSNTHDGTTWVPSDHLGINEVGQGNNWFAVRLVGTTCNKRAIGAEITVYAGGTARSQIVGGGGGYLCPPRPLIAYFGMGSLTQTQQITVDWPDGRITTIGGKPVNQVYTYVQPGLPPPCGKCPPPVEMTPAAEDPGTPSVTRLLENVPNPFNPSTEIRFALSTETAASISVFDVRGRRVASADLGNLPPGQHGWVWNGVDSRGATLGSGVYFVVLRAGAVEDHRKIVLLK